MPHGAGVLELSKKSKSYLRAGGNVKATWPQTKYDAELSTNKNNKFWARLAIFPVLIEFFTSNIKFN